MHWRRGQHLSSTLFGAQVLGRRQPDTKAKPPAQCAPLCSASTIYFPEQHLAPLFEPHLRRSQHCGATEFDHGTGGKNLRDVLQMLPAALGIPEPRFRPHAVEGPTLLQICRTHKEANAPEKGLRVGAPATSG